MAKTQWKSGDVARKSISDGWTYYARILEFPWAVFYKHRTRQPDGDLNAITSNPVLFPLAVHKSFLAAGQWESIGNVPLDGSLAPPKAQAIRKFNLFKIIDL